MRNLLDSLHVVFQDLRFALRQVLSRPATSAVAIVTMALAIGANTAIFSVVHGVLFAPLPYPEADELVLVWESDRGRGGGKSSVSPVNFRDWREASRAFDDLVVVDQDSYNLFDPAGGAEPLRVPGARVSSGFFSLLGTAPAEGRGFLPEEDVASGEKVAVISHGLWQERFGGDAAIVGSSIRVDGVATTVVGVAPAGFSFPSEAEIWTPVAFDWEQESRGMKYVVVLGRRADGTSLARARADMDRVALALAEEYPETNADLGVVVEPLDEALVGDVTAILWLLFGAVGLVLLIACANVANLSLAQLSLRRREVAVRRALGAGDGRLMRQFLTESILLSILGAGLGLLLAVWGTEVLVTRFADALPPSKEVAIDGTVLFFTVLVAVGAGIVFGLAPALRVRSTKLASPLREGTRTALGGVGENRLRRGLVLAEVALALVLLVGAGLLVRSLDRLLAADVGFDPAGKISMRVQLPERAYPEDAQQAAFADRLLEEARALPGVDRAALVSHLPLSGSRMVLTWLFRDQPVPEKINLWPVADIRAVSEGYFEVMGIPRIHGRGVEATDTADARQVAVVNRAFVEEYLPGESPLGRSFTFGDPRDDEEDVYREIVGVVGDVRQSDLAQEAGPEVYLPVEQFAGSGLTLVATPRAGEPADLTGALRSAFHAVDPALPVYEVRTLESLVRDSVREPRMAATLLGLFALLALVLAAVGVYGVLAFTVGQRKSELGLRMALGSSRGQLISLVARQGLAPVVQGLVVGAVAAYALARVLAGQLYQTAPLEPVTYLVVAALLLLVAGVAVLVPARRATRLDPAEVLRQE